MPQPPLKFLHLESSLSKLKLMQFDQLETEVLIASLLPGQPGALKVRLDGTIVDGHHRIKVLRDRGVDIETLAREILHKEESE